MSDSFDWSEFEGEEIVPTARAVVVYLNPKNDVVIRQEAFEFEGEDSWVVIPKERLPALIGKLKSIMDAN